MARPWRSDRTWTRLHRVGDGRQGAVVGSMALVLLISGLSTAVAGSPGPACGDLAMALGFLTGYRALMRRVEQWCTRATPITVYEPCPVKRKDMVAEKMGDGWVVREIAGPLSQPLTDGDVLSLGIPPSADTESA